MSYDIALLCRNGKRSEKFSLILIYLMTHLNGTGAYKNETTLVTETVRPEY